MPNNRIRDKRRPSLAARLNAQRRSGAAGYHKTNREEVLLFKKRVKNGMDPQAAREGTKITERMVDDILKGKTWASVIVLLAIAAVTMGNGCDVTDDQGVDADRVACWYLETPLCEDVPYNYKCLCLTGSAPVTSVNDDRELFKATPTPGYRFEGGDEGGETEEWF